MVTTEATDDGQVTVTIKCDACDGGTFTIATVHMETLARVLPKICEAVGIDLAAGTTEAFVFDLNDADNKRAAEAMYRDFVARRAGVKTDVH